MGVDHVRGGPTRNLQGAKRNIPDERDIEPSVKGGQGEPFESTMPSIPSTSGTHHMTYKMARREAEGATPDNEKDPYRWVRVESTRGELKSDHAYQDLTEGCKTVRPPHCQS
ncbi:hypothetical protein E2C01_079158 [Portunus trituberculatus]|uniref:Uncharacterized protein n=1 Tax=Portunus trituberculatus TaxID=210409 RepID=A0A5B7IIW7_PORTR|nr:hypothetical protein [Portunus trituberculatus]